MNIWGRSCVRKIGALAVFGDGEKKRKGRFFEFGCEGQEKR